MSREGLNSEWGGKNRKREDAQRGLNNARRRASIEDQEELFVVIEPRPVRPLTDAERASLPKAPPEALDALRAKFGKNQVDGKAKAPKPPKRSTNGWAA